MIFCIHQQGSVRFDDETDEKKRKYEVFCRLRKGKELQPMFTCES